jgi:hypothetical protein
MDTTSSGDCVRDWCLGGNIEAIRKAALDNPKILWTPDSDRRHALHWACTGADDAFLGILLRIPEASVHVNDADDAGWTPLIIASARGNAGMLQQLLDCGASADSRTESGQIALHYHKACRVSGYISCRDKTIKADLERGSNGIL